MAVSVRVHSVGLAPVFTLVYENELAVNAKVPAATYCEPVSEQPEFVMSGNAWWVDTYSETEVLHEARAASVSDILERIT